MSRPFRTSLHRTCLVKGHHEPGSQMEQECPLLKPKRTRKVVKKEKGQTAPEPIQENAR